MSALVVRLLAAVAFTGVLGTGAPVRGQVAGTVPAAGGMAGSYTAVARGYAAAAWNPAALGLTGGPRSSAMIGSVGVLTGLAPVTLADLARYEGELVPASVRQRWLDDIRGRGGQTGAAGFDITWAGIHSGRFAALVSTSGRSVNDISPGMAELILFGNADDQGQPRSLDLRGSEVDANMYSTAAIAFGTPVLERGAARLSLGVTAKYTIGHALAVTQPSLGGSTTNPIELEFSFPVAYTPVFHDGNRYWIRAGGGFGVDVAASYENGPWVLAAAAHNVLSTFAWDPERMRYRSMELVLAESTIESDDEWQPMTSAPAALRAMVDAATFEPTVTLGAAYQHSSSLLLAADARVGSTRGIATRPPVHAGAGMELRPLHWLPLQAGAAYVRLDEQRSGMHLSAGLGVELGSFLVSASAGRRDVGPGAERLIMLSVLSHSF